MRILHYFLGFPPYRTGGLTKYAFDLMTFQNKMGDEIFALWPGMIIPVFSSTKIKKRKSVNGIFNYEIINSLPVPFDEGIKEIEKFTKQCDKRIYENFLNKTKPDCIHIHTLMGLHKEFIDAANELKIKTIFTTHDYFGICPKVTFYRNGQVCNGECSYCAECNSSPLSIKKIYMLQHPLYRAVKDNYIVKQMRKKHRSHFAESSSKSSDVSNKKTKVNNLSDEKKYIKLRKYYTDILEKIDLIHYNSSVSKKIYERFITPKKSATVSITHSSIQDKKSLKKYEDDKLKIIYLAPAKPFKGYGRLIEALDEIYDSGIKNFELNIYNDPPEAKCYMNINPGYDYDELEKIFFDADILITPSVWYETFGFTVLEALSYGVPVVVSCNVGAKDIVGEDFGIISNDIKGTLLNIINDRSILIKINKNIFEHFNVKTMDIHIKEIRKLYNIFY